MSPEILGDLFLMRTIERLVAIAIGGLLVYLGFRLFLAVPAAAADGKAELSLAKDKRLIVTRIGPGTFFALFGTAVLVVSFAFPIKYAGDAGEFSGFGSPRASAQAESAAGPLPPRPLSLDEVRLALGFLADVEAAHAATLPAAERDRAARRFREARLAIMGRAWQESWGDPVEFEIWLNEIPPRSPRPAFERALAVLDGSG